MEKAGGDQDARCTKCSQASTEEVPWGPGGGRCRLWSALPLGGGGGTDRDRESTLGDGNDVDRYGESGAMN